MNKALPPQIHQQGLILEEIGAQQRLGDVGNREQLGKMAGDKEKQDRANPIRPHGAAICCG